MKTKTVEKKKTAKTVEKEEAGKVPPAKPKKKLEGVTMGEEKASKKTVAKDSVVEEPLPGVKLYVEGDGWTALEVEGAYVAFEVGKDARSLLAGIERLVKKLSK